MPLQSLEPDVKLDQFFLIDIMIFNKDVFLQ